MPNNKGHFGFGHLGRNRGIPEANDRVGKKGLIPVRNDMEIGSHGDT